MNEDMTLNEEKQKPLRIGLLLIHGIGDQPRWEHLKNVTESLAASLQTEFGVENVTVTANSPFRPRGHATIVGRVPRNYDLAGQDAQQDGVIIDIREAWWRDLAENPTASAISRFWWWAMTFCLAHKEIPSDSSRYIAPRSKAVKAGRISLDTRLSMFAKTTAFFVVLLPVHLTFQLLTVFPLLQRIHFLRTVFAYLNSVRLYQEPKSAPARILENLFECRRLSMLRRAVGEAAFFADSEEFDRWYIMGHSLGSVIAHNLVNLSPQAIARFLPDWEGSRSADSPFHLAQPVDRTLDLKDQNIPAHPCWCPDAYGVDANRFFDRLGGLVTYGSPLETFAGFWPSLVMTRRDIRMRPGFSWINLHDPIDLVAAPVKSLPPLGEVAATNISVSTHPFFFRAHTSYLSKQSGSKGHRIGRALMRWLLLGDESFAACLQERDVSCPSKFETILLKVALFAEASVILCVGSLILPGILVSLGRFFWRLTLRLHEVVSSTVVDALRDLDQSCGSSVFCSVLHVISKPGRSILGNVRISFGVLLTVFSILFTIALFGRWVGRLRAVWREARSSRSRAGSTASLGE
jgi:hypothetical protein